MTRIPAALFGIILIGCATTQPLEAVYNNLLRVAVEYVEHPRCPRATGEICAKQKIVDKLRAAETTAHAALKAYQKAKPPDKIAAKARAIAAMDVFRGILEAEGLLKEAQ